MWKRKTLGVPWPLSKTVSGPVFVDVLSLGAGWVIISEGARVGLCEWGRASGVQDPLFTFSLHPISGMPRTERGALKSESNPSLFQSHLHSSPPYPSLRRLLPRRMGRSGGGRKDPSSTCLMGALLDKALFPVRPCGKLWRRRRETISGIC